MRNSKGITIITLIGYVILSIMVISVLVAITGNFKKNFNELDVQTTQEVEFDKINLQISKEIKDGNEVNKIQTTEKELVFKDGTTYKYVQEDNAIYLNDNIKIAEHITNCKFEIVNDKILRVTPEIKDEKRVLEYPITTFIDRSYLKIGDYVDYTPDTAGNYLIEAKYSGYDSDQSIPQDTTLKWRIMSINEDGNVDLVADKPTETKVYLKGALGYNNGVLLLNDLCKKQYSNNGFNIKARSINLIDIERKMNSTALENRNAYTFNELHYGESRTYSSSSSSLYSPHIYMYTSKTNEGEAEEYYVSPTEKTFVVANTLEVKETNYIFINTPVTYFDNSEFYMLIFGTKKYFWLASRYSEPGAAYALFGLRIVSENNLASNTIFFSNNGGATQYNAVRPVISITPDIKISLTGGTEDNPRTLSK